MSKTGHVHNSNVTDGFRCDAPAGRMETGQDEVKEMSCLAVARCCCTTTDLSDMNHGYITKQCTDSSCDIEGPEVRDCCQREIAADAVKDAQEEYKHDACQKSACDDSRECVVLANQEGENDQNVTNIVLDEQTDAKTNTDMPDATQVNIEVVCDCVTEDAQSVSNETGSMSEAGTGSHPNDNDTSGDMYDSNALLDNFNREYNLRLINHFANNGFGEEEIERMLTINRESDIEPPPEPPYPVGDYSVTTCEICLGYKRLHHRMCCRFPVCDDCLSRYISTQVQQGIAKIECLNTKCTKYVHKDEILARLNNEDKDKFYRFLVEANREANIKTCPQCCHILTIDIALLGSSKVKKKGLKVICPSCFLVWCFPCQAPWHEGVSCRDYRKGDRLLRQWAKEHHYGQANAQKCPSCKVYIQRSTGCDHMQCSRCKTNFCYRCGDRYMQVRFLGDHYSRMSILGCKYRFKPDKPAQRRLIRGAVFGVQLMVAPLVGGLALASGAVLLGVSAIALPFYGGYKVRQKLEERKRRRRRFEAAAEWRAKLDAIRKRGDPYLENWNHLSSIGYTPPLPPLLSSAPQGEELEISMPQSNTDNLEELLMSSLLSKADSLPAGLATRSDGGDSCCSCESEEMEPTITQVKVITENVDPALLLDSDTEAKDTGSQGPEVKDTVSNVRYIDAQVSEVKDTLLQVCDITSPAMEIKDEEIQMPEVSDNVFEVNVTRSQEGMLEKCHSKSSSIVEASWSYSTEERSPDNVVEASRSSSEESSPDNVEASRSSSEESSPDNVVEASRFSSEESSPDNIVEASRSSSEESSPDNVEASRSSSEESSPDNAVEASRSSSEESSPDIAVEASRSSSEESSPDNAVEASRSSSEESSPDNAVEASRSSSEESSPDIAVEASRSSSEESSPDNVEALDRSFSEKSCPDDELLNKKCDDLECDNKDNSNNGEERVDESLVIYFEKKPSEELGTQECSGSSNHEEESGCDQSQETSTDEKPNVDGDIKLKTVEPSEDVCFVYWL